MHESRRGPATVSRMLGPMTWPASFPMYAPAPAWQYMQPQPAVAMAAAWPMLPTAVPMPAAPAQPAAQHVFAAPNPFQMCPAQSAAVRDILQTQTKVASMVVETKQQRHAVVAAALREKGCSRACSAKKGVKERQYSEEDFLSMVRDVISGAAPSAHAAARDAGFLNARRSLSRYVTSLRENESLRRATPEETVVAQLQLVDSLTLKQKGNIDLTSRRLFSDDELDVIARTLKLYAEMGWPFDYQQIRLMMSDAARRAKRTDWTHGKAYVVSTSYVSAFVRGRPELQAYKASHIDPLRSKKATAKARLMPGPRVSHVLMPRVLDVVCPMPCLHVPYFIHPLGEILAKFLIHLMPPTSECPQAQTLC